MDPDIAEFLSRPPEPGRPYLYPGTSTHINKFDILNPVALNEVARKVSDLRAQLLKTSPIEGNYDLDHLCEFHRYLFQDVYHWAGELRIVDFDLVEVPCVKPDRIVIEANGLFADLRMEQHFRDLTLQEFAERIAHYLERLYNIHPFRDGNGRSSRAFFSQLANEHGWNFDLSSVSQTERHDTARAAYRGDLTPLVTLIRRVTTSIERC